MIMKNALLCILFGLFCGIASCSMIKMGKRNIKVQTDTTILRYHTQFPPAVPANQVIVEQPVQRRSTRPFKDSLINGLLTINNKVDLSNRKLDSNSFKLDSLLTMQTDAVHTRKAIQETILEMSATMNDLRTKNTQLSKTVTLSKDIKDDAIVGNTLRTFVVGALIFIAVVIMITLFLIIVFHRNLSNNIKRFKQHAT